MAEETSNIDFTGIAEGVVSILQGITGTGTETAAVADQSSAVDAMVASNAQAEADRKAAMNQNLMIGGGILVGLVLIFFAWKAFKKKK